MKIILLGSENINFSKKIEKLGDEVISTEKELHHDDKILEWADFILVYSYRFIISEEIIKRFEYKIVNMHISYLPRNRGADPNMWSIIDNTPKGVSIHYIDVGIDTGPIILQKIVEISLEDTLRQSYEKLQDSIQKLLLENWENIKKGTLVSFQHKEKGTHHFSKDSIKIKENLFDGWDTTGFELIQIYSKIK